MGNNVKGIYIMAPYLDRRNITGRKMKNENYSGLRNSEAMGKTQK